MLLTSNNYIKNNNVFLVNINMQRSNDAVQN